MECLIDGVDRMGTASTYIQPPGYFGVRVVQADATGKMVPKLNWFGCREGFHTYVDPIRQGNFYFVHHAKRGVDVANFIYRLEEMMELTRKSLFKYTENEAVCYVEVAPWWLDLPMRYSFYTIALRAAMNWQRHQKMDWRTTLLSQPYAGATPTAVDRFLAGYTHYTGQVRGWSRQFTGQDNNYVITPAQIQTLLVKPRYTDAERYAFIQNLAYEKWEKAGKPCSDGSNFWKTAEGEYRTSYQFGNKPA